MKLIFVKTIGGCMRPLIKSGDIVCLKKKINYRLGDIVLYEINGQKFLHRIVKVLPEREYIVLDDMCITSLVKIHYKDILGFYPTVFGGLFGWIYHIVIKAITLFKRKIL